MTPTDYANRYQKTVATVYEYLSKGFILGAVNENNEWIIPEDAKLPYTENRIKPTSDQPAIYKSILNGVMKNRGVSHRVLGMTEEDFNGYIEVLIRSELIIPSTLSHDVITYMITQRGIEAASTRGKNVIYHHSGDSYRWCHYAIVSYRFYLRRNGERSENA